MNKILFLDRDGVINIDKGHVYKISDFEFQDGIFDLCLEAIKKGYIICVVTNQGGIGKGYYTLEDLHILNNWMINEFMKKGIEIKKIYYCPHHPNDLCYCRKPNPWMINKALEEFDGDRENSVLVGDKMSDLEAGFNAKIKKLIFVKRQYKEYQEIFSYKKVDNLKEIIDII